MVSTSMQVGMCFDRTFPPELVVELADSLEDAGADQLWVIEDCFYTAGVTLAAAALTATERLTVGIGILPALARNPAVTAMEFATLAGLAPGRVLPGIGHGVQAWMAQMGARPASPLTALEEVLTAVRRLLAGEKVTAHGRYVDLDDVQLDQPPQQPVPVLAGVRGPRSLALAGRVADGLLIAEPTSPSYVRQSLQQSGRDPGDFHIAGFDVLCVAADRRAAYRTMAPWLATMLDEPTAGMTALPFFDDLAARYAQHGLDGLVTMPRQWWTELAPVGTMDDAAEHLQALEDAGVRSLGLYPVPDVERARVQVADVAALAAS